MTSTPMKPSCIRSFQNLWDGVHFDGGIDATLNGLANTAILAKGGVLHCAAGGQRESGRKTLEATTTPTRQAALDLGPSKAVAL